MTKRAYTLGNYAKFVRPGYVMVDVTGNSNASLLLSAFKGTDGTVVVVAVNKGTSAATVPITIAGGTAPASCTPNVTSSSANLAAGTRGHGDGRDLHRLARRDDGDDVRLQVAPALGHASRGDFAFRGKSRGPRHAPGRTRANSGSLLRWRRRCTSLFRSPAPHEATSGITSRRPGDRGIFTPSRS